MIGSMIGHKIAKKKYAILGIVVMIGSIGLLLGGVACATAALFMIYGGFELIPAMMLGFFTSGFGMLLFGALLILIGSKS